jgi:hypothetical protein
LGIRRQGGSGQPGGEDERGKGARFHVIILRLHGFGGNAQLVQPQPRTVGQEIPA